MYTVSTAMIAWFALAWFVVGILCGYLVPAVVLRALAGRRATAGGGSGGGAAQNGARKGEGVEIYVGNLAYSVSKRDLEKKFGEFGVVNDVRIIRNQLTGKSRGYGFIQMADRKGAQKAVAAINGQDIKGRAIVANEAKSRARDE